MGRERKRFGKILLPALLSQEKNGTVGCKTISALVQVKLVLPVGPPTDAARNNNPSIFAIGWFDLQKTDYYLHKLLANIWRWNPPNVIDACDTLYNNI